MCVGDSGNADSHPSSLVLSNDPGVQARPGFGLRPPRQFRANHLLILRTQTQQTLPSVALEVGTAELNDCDAMLRKHVATTLIVDRSLPSAGNATTRRFPVPKSDGF